jgi:hypothetical protein
VDGVSPIKNTKKKIFFTKKCLKMIENMFWVCQILKVDEKIIFLKNKKV